VVPALLPRDVGGGSVDTERLEGKGDTQWNLDRILGALKQLEYMYSSRADDVGMYSGFIGPIWRCNLVCHTVESAKFIQGMARNKGLKAWVGEKSPFGERLVVLSLDLDTEDIERWERR
jgi:hypothetical protein